MDNCDCKNYNCIYIISTRNIAVCFWSTSSKYSLFNKKKNEYAFTTAEIGFYI